MTFIDATPSCSAEGGYTPTLQKPKPSWLAASLRAGETRRYAVTVQLSPALARDILGQCNGRNRSLSRARAIRYARIIEDGRWMLTSQGMAFSREGELLDGQHRCKAVDIAGVTVPMTMWFGCDAAEFAVLDNGGARTGADVLMIAGQPQAKTLAAFARLLAIVSKERALDPNAIAVFASGLDFDRAQEACTVGGRGRAIAAPSTLALAHYWIATHSAQNAHLHASFWEKFISGAGLQKGAMLTFREGLLRSKHNKTRVTSDLQILTAGEVVAQWNSFASNRKRVDMTGVSGSTLPASL